MWMPSPRQKKDPEKEKKLAVKQAFFLLDKDKSGKLGANEFDLFMNALEIKPEGDAGEKMVSCDFSRFSEIIRSNSKTKEVSEMVRVFERYDLNDNRQLSRKEVIAWFESMGMCNQRLLDATWHKLDLDDDGTVDFSEVCALVTGYKAPEIDDKELAGILGDLDRNVKGNIF
eukprot:17968_1